MSIKTSSTYHLLQHLHNLHPWCEYSHITESILNYLDELCKLESLSVAVSSIGEDPKWSCWLLVDQTEVRIDISLCGRVNIHTLIGFNGYEWVLDCSGKDGRLMFEMDFVTKSSFDNLVSKIKAKKE